MVHVETVLPDKLMCCHTRIMPQHKVIIPSGHSILTPNRPVISLFPKKARRYGGAAERIPSLKSLVWRDRDGVEPTVFRHESRRSTNWAIDAGKSYIYFCHFSRSWHSRRGSYQFLYHVCCTDWTFEMLKKLSRITPSLHVWKKEKNGHSDCCYTNLVIFFIAGSER